MPKFKVTDHQTGQTLIVSGDSPPTEAEAEQIFKDAGGGVPTPAEVAAQRTAEAGQHGIVDTAVDMARSLPGGLAKGGAAIAGLPGDINAGLTAGLDWAAVKSGAMSPEDMQRMREARATIDKNSIIPSPPTSGKIVDTVSKPFGGLYEPKTTAGHFTETVASFALNAAAPGSLAARAARVVVPGVASEAAGQATKGNKWEPVARAIGALGGGLAEGIGEGAIHAKLNPTMTMEELRKAKTATYKAAEQHGVVIKDSAWKALANDIATEMHKTPFRADLHEGATSALDTIASEKGHVTLENADAIRQVVNDAIETASKNNGGDVRRATKIKGMLDEFLDNLTPADTVSGDASVAVPILKNARALAQREFKAKKIQELIDLAENQASSNFTGAGKEQALRVQFKNFNARLIKDPQLAKSFSAPERAAIEKVAQGGPVGNVLRYFGKLAPTGVISGGAGATAGAVIGSTIGGPVGAGIGSIALPAFGAASRAGATVATSHNARMAEELMRAGKTNPGATSIPRNVLLSTLLSQGGH